MANPYKEHTLDQLMSAGEQPGSQASYYVDREMQRRRELAQQVVDEKLIASAEAQIEAAGYAKDTARWTKMSAIAIAVSVVVMAIGTVITAIASLK